jgi:CHAD domain-containing protein
MSETASPASPTLNAFLDDKVKELSDWIPRAFGSGDRDAVHQARVTTRRLKAGLDLLKPALTPDARRSFAKVLRRLRRSLGPLRDFDVMLEHLGELRADPRFEAIVTWLQGTFIERRTELLGDLVKRRPPQKLVKNLQSWSDLQMEVSQLEPTARALAQGSVLSQLDSFKERADAVSRMNTDADCLSGEDLHELRIAGKLLRYTLELSQPVGYQLPAAVFRSFKKLQEALGLWHDFVVLGEQSLRAALDGMLATTDPKLYGQALELARDSWHRTERHLGHFRELWRKRGNLIAQEIERVFATASSDQEASTSGATVQAASESAPDEPGAEPQKPTSSIIPDSNGSEPPPSELTGS